MTEPIERPKLNRKAVAMKTYRDRVHALYADVRSWLSGDDRFRLEQSASVVRDGLGRYAVDRLRVFAGEERIAEFEPIAATVIMAAGQVDVLGLVDYAWLIYYETPPIAVTTLTDRRGHTTRSSFPIIEGIDRPGWYWTDARHDDGARFLDNRTLFDIFEEISDLESQPHREPPRGSHVVS
ncbi:MAG TPA: hypothetical protein VHS78_17580 [Candidatus Elarobacter sp.]|jgi:hypothetical protein|nr:hypothetical protein [Candidatus Elarobacter sp.]